MKKKLIKPSAEALQVRKPDGTQLSPDGEELMLTAFWRRRYAEGDVTIEDIPLPKTDAAEVNAPATKPTKAEK